LNRKKAGYEQVFEVDRCRELLTWIAVLNGPFLIFTAVSLPALLPAIGGFFFFTIF